MLSFVIFEQANPNRRGRTRRPWVITGVVKITPAHDPNDFWLGQRHNLPRVNVMNDDGTMNELAGELTVINSS